MAGECRDRRTSRPVTRKPDSVKNVETPRKPPTMRPRPAWKATTATTANPRRPSRPGRFVNGSPTRRRPASEVCSETGRTVIVGCCQPEGRRGTPAEWIDRSGQVLEASKMLWVEASSAAVYSSADCWADRPSVKAREKLAITPGLRARRALASSRL